MKLIVFLGNPGKKYRLTRHNIGFLLGEYIADKTGIALTSKSFSGFYGKGRVEGRDCVLLAPHTFMNGSGESVQPAMNYFDVESEEMLVVHDEIELSFGDVRFKKGGGHKGHNGIRSIMQKTGNGDFYRLRFGVGRPENPHISVADYVLSNFTKEEQTEIQLLFPDVFQRICQEFLSCP